MKQSFHSPRIPLRAILTVLTLLLVVNLYADTAEQCKYEMDSVYACSAACSMSAQSCVPGCHLTSSLCTLSKKTHPTSSTAKATRSVSPGLGKKILSSVSTQCLQKWNCAPAPIEMAECNVSGSSSNCVHTETPNTCYVCLQGAPLAPCTASVSTLGQCQLGGG